jgi:hypothetical protein
MHCGSVWNWHGITGESQCSKFKADIAFCFLASIFFLVSALLVSPSFPLSIFFLPYLPPTTFFDVESLHNENIVADVCVYRECGLCIAAPELLNRRLRVGDGIDLAIRGRDLRF